MKRLLSVLLLGSTLTHADLNHEQLDALAAEAARLAPASAPVVQQNLVTPQQYKTLGSWSPIIAWTPHIPVTAAQLPDGRLLTFASSQRTSFPVENFTYAAVWDYRTGEFVEINNTRHDMFCGGVSLLPDGRLLANGGNDITRSCSLFDWQTNSWIATEDMKDGRWYNTSLALPDGTVFTASGSGGSDTAEHWQAANGWGSYPNINWALVHSEGGFESIWHPFLHLAPDGRIAHTGPTHTMHWIDTKGDGQLINTPTTIPGAYYPKDGAVVMFDTGKILHSAGRTTGGGASNLAYVVDINGQKPTITPTSNLKRARTFANGVILPNGEVMAVGGNTSQEKFSDVGSVMTPEIWNPTTGQWRDAADMQVPRNYHSVALLLPDGRVWSAGGGLSGSSADHQDAQIYTPGCLFNADGTPATRPVISTAPRVIPPAQVFHVTASTGMQRFTLIKLAALTHSVTSDLRFLSLPFTESSAGEYDLQAHTSLNVMTPGYWMLFAVAADGTYSESQILKVAPPIGNPGTQNSLVNSALALTIETAGYNETTRVFTASGLPAGLSIDSTTGIISGTPTDTGTQMVTITVSDGVRPTTSISFEWLVYTALSLEPLANPPALVGADIIYTAQTAGGIRPRFRWSFGDGTAETAFSDSNVITKSFANPGRYIVTLTVRDATGREVTTSLRQAVHAPLSATRPTVSSTIAYQAVNGANARLWVVNPDQDNVTVFDAITRARLAIIPVGSQPRSIAVAADGSAWVVNSESATLSIISPALSVTQTVPLQRGSRPYAVVFDPAGTTAYVSLQDIGSVLKINSSAPTQIISSANTGPDVRHLSVSADGSKVFPTRFITPRLPGEETANVVTEQNGVKFGGQALVIDAATMTVTKTIILEHSNDEDSSIAGRGIPNYLGPAVLSPDGLSAWVPSKKDNIKRGMLRDGKPLTHDNTVRSITSRIDLATQTEDFAARIDFNDAGIATSATYEKTGMYLFTLLEGSREVVVVDAWGKRELLRFTSGRAPQGAVVSPDGRTLFVHNFMDRSVTIHDISAIIDGAEVAPTLTATLNCITAEKLAANVLIGKQLFYDSRDQRLALQQYVSCAACHNDGDQDGRVWDFTGFGEGLRNTITMRGHADHGALHWTGNFDEIQDFEGQIRGFAKGLGLMSDNAFHTGTRDQSLGERKSGLSTELDALAAYAASLTTSGDSPSRNNDGSLTADAVAGQQIFRSQNCASCHSGTRFTNSALNVSANIGTIKPSSGQRLNGALTGFDVPTLRGLWNTGPYLHDGSATTLSEAVRAHQGVLLTDIQLSQVVSFLSQIDDSITSAPAPLSIVLAVANTTGSGPFNITGLLNMPASGFGSDDISVSGGTVSGFVINGTSFGFNVTPTTASQRIEIAANVMTDTTGLGNVASNVLNTNYTPPVSVVLTTSATAVNGTFTVNAQFSTTVAGVSTANFNVTNGTVIGLSGSGSLWIATIQPATAGNVSVNFAANAIQDNSVSNTLSVSYVPASFMGARINFQNTGAPVPADSIADTGLVFDARHGMNFGWNTDHSTLGRDRDVVTNQRLDTHIRMRAGATWEIAVPNGSYDLVVSVGDASSTSTNTLRVEGTTLWNTSVTPAAQFQTRTLRVTVADRRLTLDNVGAANLSTALAHISITPVIPPSIPGQHGLLASYFAGSNFEQCRFTRVDSNIDFMWNATAPDARLSADRFSIRWQGYLVPRVTERHTLTTVSDDGVRLWINGNQVINNWSTHNETTNTTEVDLQAGQPVPVQMEFYHSDGNAVARLQWQSASQPLEVIPAERLLTTADGSGVKLYPSTFAEWLSSGRSNGAGSSAATNNDGDDLPDLLEYALGASAGTGIDSAEHLHLDTSGGHVSASVIHPTGITDVRWLLESSTDLKNWTTLLSSPVVADNGDGTETLRWENLDALPGLALSKGIVRLKVQLLSNAEVAASAPVAWQQTVVQSGTQTVGINVVSTPVFAGIASTGGGNAVFLNDASWLPGVVDSDARYYLEVRSGPNAGHRWDLSQISDRVLLIDTESGNNTKPSIPTSIAGAHIAVHRHVTLGQVFNKAIMQGSNNPALADQVLFHTPSGFRGFWLLQSGTRNQWTSYSDASLNNMDNTIVPPGTGVMLKSSGTTPRSIFSTGQVRVTPFAHGLAAGQFMLASPWPLDASPASSNLTDRTVFTPTNNPATADAVQLWRGDTQPGSSGYFGYWFLRASATSSWWSTTGDAGLKSINNTILFRAGMAYFVNLRHPPSQAWVIPAP